MYPSKDPTGLSQLFHQNSEPWSEDIGDDVLYYQEFRHPPDVLSRVDLPPPDETGLLKLIRQRKSERHFQPRELSRSSLSGILAAAYGALDIRTMDNGSQFLNRSVPSAGGLYPLELFLFLQRVEGLEDGLFHYDVVSHSLQLLQSGNQSAQLESAFYSYPFMVEANVVLCIAAVFLRSQKKYGPRGYRYILLEAGHSAQNVCLAATELGLGSLCMGGYVDSILNRILGLTPNEAGVVYSVAVG